MSSRWPGRLLGLYFLTFPLLNVGVGIGGYPFSIPFVILIAYSASLLLRARIAVQSNVLLAASLFLLWAVATAAPRLPWQEFAPSLGVLFFLWVPFWALPPGVSRSDVARVWLVRGLYLCYAICAYQLATRFVSLPKLDVLLPTIVPQRTSYMAGFARVNGLMVEPAMLALYLSFGFIWVDLLLAPSRRKRVTQGIALLLLVGTFSLSGISVLITYLTAKYVLLLRYKRWLIRVGLVVFVLLVTLVLWGPRLAQSAPGIYLSTRAELVWQWFENPLSGQTGSEAARLGALILGAQYVAVGEAVWGEGFAHSEQWVAAHYATNGQIHNLYSYLVIGVGLVGLGLYLFFLTSLRLPLLGRPKALRAAFIAWLVAAMATGHFIQYYYWGFLLPIYFVRMDESKGATCDSP